MSTLHCDADIFVSVYVTVAAGNSGGSGILTSGTPAVTPSAISVASVDNAYALKYTLLTPDNSKVYYQATRSFVTVGSTFKSRIVVNGVLEFAVVHIESVLSDHFQILVEQSMMDATV